MSDQLGLYFRRTAEFHLGVMHATFKVFQFGDGGNHGIPVFGDWDGTGFDKPGLYFRESAEFHLGNMDGQTIRHFQFGDGGNEGIPVVGDWDGTGIDKPGLYFRGSAEFHLGNMDGQTIRHFQFGDGGNDGIPVVGDWQPTSDLYRIQIVRNGRPSEGTGTRITNDSGIPAVIAAGTLAIVVPDGGEGGIEQDSIGAKTPLIVWKFEAGDPPMANTAGTLEISGADAVPVGHVDGLQIHPDGSMRLTG